MTRMKTTIELAGDYMKYENHKFFESFHTLPTIEARLFKGAEGDDESVDEEIYTNYHAKRSQEEYLKRREVYSIHERNLVSASLGYKLYANKRKDILSAREPQYSEAFIEDQIEKSAMEYDQIRREVIARLNDLGLVKSRKSVQINQVPKSKYGKVDSSKRQSRESKFVGTNSNDKHPVEVESRAADIQVNPTPKGFLRRFGQSLSDLFYRPFKKTPKRRGR